MDKFIDQLPFFTPEHRALAADMESFVQLEIEPRASEEREHMSRSVPCVPSAKIELRVLLKGWPIAVRRSAHPRRSGAIRDFELFELERSMTSDDNGLARCRRLAGGECKFCTV